MSQALLLVRKAMSIDIDIDTDMITNNNKSKTNSKCPIDKTPLSTNIDGDYEYQYCSSCKREYFQIQNDDQSKLEYDIETVSEEREGGPILLSEKVKEPKPDSYLRRHFGSGVSITTELYIPE